MRIVVRDRIDVPGEPNVSYMHKVWISDVSEEVIQEEFYRITMDSKSEEIPGVVYYEIAANHPPQPTYENSDWGCGLPGVGDIWKGIPAADRK